MKTHGASLFHGLPRLALGVWPTMRSSSLMDEGTAESTYGERLVQAPTAPLTVVA